MKLVIAAIFLLCLNVVHAQSLLIETSRPIPVSKKSTIVAEQKSRLIEKSWALNCTGQTPKCKMEYIPAAIDSAQFSISIEILKISKKQPAIAIAIIKTPLNLLLPAGLVLRPDRMKMFRLAIRSCHADVAASSAHLSTSCLAPFRLTKNIITAFKRGNQFKIEAKTIDSQTLSEPISLMGFTKIYAALLKSQTRKN